jgi:hypothetical protein
LAGRAVVANLAAMTYSLMVRVRVLLAALLFGAVFLGAYAARAHAYDRMIIRT